MPTAKQRFPEAFTKLTALWRRWALVGFCLGLGLILTLVLTVRFTLHQPIVVGQPSARTFNAPRDLTFVSEVATEAARRQAENDPANLVYNESVQVHQNQRQQLQSAFDTITALRGNPSIDAVTKQQQITEIPSISIESTIAELIIGFNDDDWQRVRDQSNALYDRTLRNYDYSIDEIQLQEIKERYLPYNLSTTLSEEQRQVVLYFVDHTLQANRTLNLEATQRRKAEARAQVPPVNLTIVKGENIVRQGDRVTSEQYEKLVKLGLIMPSLDIAGIFGRSLLALLAALMLTLYVALYVPNYQRRLRIHAVIGMLLLIAVLIGRWFLTLWINSPELYALAMISISLAVLFGGQLAIVVAALAALLVGFLADGSFQLLLTSMAGAVGGAVALRRSDRAVDFFRAGLIVALSVAAASLSWHLVRPTPLDWEDVGTLVGFSALNGSISAVTSFAIHNLLGRIAGIITSTQLMELAHPNQPLLRRLMQEAPGTYHHSIVVSNLAEHAAERIGADPLLTRVGAYYHDIGKMLRPYFFTDNQYDRSNVHDDLDPKTSAKLIADHVIEGARLARKSGLPQRIIDFILEHHGQDVIRYFYQKALQQEDDPDINDYRYPGPKPQTKETALLMLADGVEATVRSHEQSGRLITERDREQTDHDLPRGAHTIAEIVQQIVEARLASGQLDECPLTLRDVQEIRSSFVKTLQGIYHPRVEYPKLTKEAQSQP